MYVHQSPTAKTVVVPQSAVLPSVDVFANLARRSPAPAWVHAGIARRWDLDASSLTASLISVSENATFRVAVEGVDIAVVRLHRPGYVENPEQIVGELLWVEAIAAETSITVSLPVRGSDGRPVQFFLDTAGAEWTAVMFDFVEGDILEAAADPAPHYGTIGRTTAELHAHARSWQKPAGFTRFSWELSDLLGPGCRWGTWEVAAMCDDERALLRLAESRALAVLARLEKTEDRWGLIHSDLRPSNIMINNDALTVIDFDDAGFGWYLYDFASALSFIEHTEGVSAMAKDWVAGYREVLPFSAEDARLAGAFVMVRRLTMLGWTTTHRADALPASLLETIVSGSVQVAERYLISETWLLDDDSSGDLVLNG
jgi:Ser/Thr protein kinase RdoA (MazF antagonist)